MIGKHTKAALAIVLAEIDDLRQQVSAAINGDTAELDNILDNFGTRYNSTAIDAAIDCIGCAMQEDDEEEEYQAEVAKAEADAAAERMMSEEAAYRAERGKI